jgi:hypothetical protein
MSKVNLNIAENKEIKCMLKDDQTIGGTYKFKKDKEIVIKLEKREDKDKEIKDGDIFDVKAASIKGKVQKGSDEKEEEEKEVKDVKIKLKFSKGYFYDGAKVEKLDDKEVKENSSSEIRVASDLMGVNYPGWGVIVVILLAVIAIGYF